MISIEASSIGFQKSHVEELTRTFLSTTPQTTNAQGQIIGEFAGFTSQLLS